MGGKRITDFQVDRCRALWLSGKSMSEIAQIVGISTTAVSYTVRGLPRECQPPREGDEAWERLSEINDRYFISSHGRVYTDGTSAGAAKLLDLAPCKRVRSKVTLSSNGKPGRYFVDRLVATHFCEGHSDECDSVVHLDGDLSNNCADNLAWSLGEDAPAVKSGRTRVPSSDISDDMIEKTVGMWESGMSKEDVSTILSIPIGHVTKILRGRTRDAKPPCEPGERWAKLGDPKGRYYVSSHGRMFTNGDGSGEAKILKQHLGGPKGKCEYPHVCVDDGDGMRTRTVHRLVAKYFCDGWSPTNNVVNHIDGNPQNNHADNLEWCTQSDNILHAVHVLGRKLGCSPEEMSAKLKGRPNRHQRKLTDEQVREIRDDPRSSRQLATVYGVDKATINRIRSRESCADVL